jgi:hypothetical protein
MKQKTNMTSCGLSHNELNEMQLASVIEGKKKSVVNGMREDRMNGSFYRERPSHNVYKIQPKIGSNLQREQLVNRNSRTSSQNQEGSQFNVSPSKEMN